MKLKNILFDFDGVILDSMPIREEGFRTLFSDYPIEQVELLLKYHRANGGLSRYVKIRYFYEEVLKTAISEQALLQYAGNFSDIMREKLADINLLIEDSISFIKNNHEEFRMHIVSGSDGDELRYLCQQLSISQFFVTIEGSPTPKKELVGAILEKYSYNPKETVLIGDSYNDYEAAIANKLEFLGYRFTYSEESLNHIVTIAEMGEISNQYR